MNRLFFEEIFSLIAGQTILLPAQAEADISTTQET